VRQVRVDGVEDSRPQPIRQGDPVVIPVVNAEVEIVALGNLRDIPHPPLIALQLHRSAGALEVGLLDHQVEVEGQVHGAAHQVRAVDEGLVGPCGSHQLEDEVQAGHHFAIIDEVDSILIDEARTPLIISQPDEESAKLYVQFAGIVPRLEESKHYNVDEKMRTVVMTQEGIDAVEHMLGISNIYGQADIRLIHHLESALKAKVLYKLDKDYVVKDGEVIIVDEFTGRLMQGRRFSEGLHQALEAKEGVEIQRESKTLATITTSRRSRSALVAEWRSLSISSLMDASFSM